MAFSCGILLTDIDIVCQKVAGGIKKVILYSQNDVSIITDPYDESIILSVDAVNPYFVEFNSKDGTTNFSENKSITNGLPVVTTTITIQIPNINAVLNKIDMLGVRNDLVAVLWHNNDTVTISGVMDGLVMSYDADSGTGLSEKSFINLTLSVESGIGSIAVNDTGVFVDKSIFA